MFHLLPFIFVSDTSWLRLSVLLVKMIVPTGTATATNSGMRPTVNFTGSSNHRPTSKIFCIFCIFVFLYLMKCRQLEPLVESEFMKRGPKNQGWRFIDKVYIIYKTNTSRHFFARDNQVLSGTFSSYVVLFYKGAQNHQE